MTCCETTEQGKRMRLSAKIILCTLAGVLTIVVLLRKAPSQVLLEQNELLLAEVQDHNGHTENVHLPKQLITVTNANNYTLDNTLQRDRKNKVQKVCQRNLKLHRNKDEVISDRFFHLFVDDRLKFIYCEVPKVACTNWKRIMLILTGKMNTTDPVALPGGQVHEELQKKYLRRLNTYSSNEIQYRLENYYKFMFVRNPLERILSAYINKFTLKYNEYFHVRYGRTIIRRYRKNPSKESLEKGNDVTFQEFIQYLLDPATTRTELFNSHWRHYYQLCLPCVVKYDFIGKLETLDSDISTVLHKIHAENLVKFPEHPAPRQPHTSDILRTSYANISSESIHRLWELYSVDFAMFGYEYPDMEDTHY